jgi:hypothetical protein
VSVAPTIARFCAILMIVFSESRGRSMYFDSIDEQLPTHEPTTCPSRGDDRHAHDVAVQAERRARSSSQVNSRSPSGRCATSSSA